MKNRPLLLSIVTGLLSVVLVGAQANCSALLIDALQAVDENCTGLARNEACYGYDQVEASFLVAVTDDYFSLPSNTTPVADLATIRTAPLNTETGVWGVALMNLQANLPNTLPGQNVTFVLLGDVEVENAVAPEEAFQPNDGIELSIKVAAGANVRSGPSTNFNVLGGLRYQETLLADGLSADAQWLRIAYRERPAWISRTVVSDSAAIDELPILSADLHTPMQAFYLRTGIGQPECGDAIDDILLVQGPENIEIELTVNGANIELGSSGAMRIVEIDGQFYLEIIVFDGIFKVDGKEIHKGQHSFICMGNEDSRGLDGEDNDLIATCGASEPETIDSDEFGEEWCILEEIPSDLLHYGLEILCPGEVPAPAPRGSAGQGATDSQIAGVSCARFSLLSPLFPVNSGIHTFSWTAVTGEAISYELVFYNQGQQVNVFPTSATSHTLNLGAETATGGSFQWEVRAFSNGQYACVSYRSQEIMRTSELDNTGQSGGGNQGNGGFTARLSCSTSRLQIATVNYSGAGRSTVTMTATLVNATAIVAGTATGSGPSGSLSLSATISVDNVVVSTSNGDRLALGNCP